MASNQSNVGTARRKNGKESSCEPCRMSKIRCDHARPICSRCRQRSLHSQCFYHPAPLAKKKLSSAVDLVDTTMLTTQLEESPVAQPTPATTTSSRPVEGPHLKSFDRIFNRTRTDYVTRVAEILNHLRDFDRIQHLMASYWPVSQSAILPEALIMSGMSGLAEMITQICTVNDNDMLQQCAKAILDSTSTRIVVTAALSPKEFMALFTVPKLRLEYLGLIFSITARSYLIGLAKYGARQKAFLQEMYQCSSTCLQLARELSPVNDMTTWLAQDQATLTGAIEGDSSERHYQCLGDLHLDIFALGIYRESFITTDTPFFLADCRRRTFARAYRNDNFMATLLDRPPRLLKRRCNTQLPLDLSDDELLADADELAMARARLSPDGWSEGRYTAATWARVRSITAETTEEIFDHRWLPITADLVVNLKNLADKNRKIWTSLPAHVQYSSYCWQSGVDPQNCYLLVVIFLGFLHNEFQIFQMLERHDTEAGLRLIEVSFEIVSLVLELGSFRRKAIYMHARFSDVLLYHGLAPALLLSQALAKSKSVPSSLPSSVRRPVLVRRLSSFVSQLESIAGPGEANYDICAHASEMITSTIDEVIDSGETAAPSSTSDNNLSASLDLDMAAFSTGYPDIWEGFDVNEWQRNIDWSVGYDGF